MSRALVFVLHLLVHDRSLKRGNICADSIFSALGSQSLLNAAMDRTVPYWETTPRSSSSHSLATSSIAFD